MRRFDYITTKEQLTNATIDLDLYSADELLELSHLYKKFYPINEMSYDRSEFIGLCGNLAEQIHFNIINIVILGNYFPENINHWKAELMGHIKQLFNKHVERSVKKDKLILLYMIGMYIDERLMIYEDDEIIIDAINDEIRKGEKTDKMSAKFIKENILPNTYELMEQYNNDFKQIFISLVNTFKYKDLNIFSKEINKYCKD